MKLNKCVALVRGVLVLGLAGYGTIFSPVPATAQTSDPAPVMQVDLGKGVSMDFILIHPGSFTMGSAGINPAALMEPENKAKRKQYDHFYGGANEQPAHAVTIGKPFYLGKYEVTQEQWQALMEHNPAKHRDPKNPVEQVSWMDCTNFVARLNHQLPDKHFNLPSEAQWEYACRAGSTTEYCYGDDKERLEEYAWYQIGKKIGSPHPVGEKKPNAWGLYDMHGNVWEWCLDVYHPNYEGAPTDGSAWTDPVKTESGKTGMTYRVQRGGGYASVSASVRSAHRGKDQQYMPNGHYGLRLLLEIP